MDIFWKDENSLGQGLNKNRKKNSRFSTTIKTKDVESNKKKRINPLTTTTSKTRMNTQDQIDLKTINNIITVGEYKYNST